MSKKLAIKGHETRGKEIIELLEMMGGINKNMLSAHIGDVLNPHVYFLELDSSDNRIVWNYLLGLEWDGRASDMMIFTLEEFLEKYPYKLNDLALCDDGLLGIITKMEWDCEKSDMKYYISFKISDYNKWYSSKNIICTFMEVKGKKLAIKGHSTRGKEVIELLEMLGGSNDQGYIGTNTWKDEYYFLDNGCIRAYDWCDGIKFTLEEFWEKYPFKIGDKVIDEADGCPGVVCEMKWDEDVSDMKYCVAFGNGVDFGWFANDSINFFKIKKNENLEENKFPPFEPMFKMNDELEYMVPDGYEITEVSKDKVFIKPIKSKYPKTLGDCCKVILDIGDYQMCGYKHELLFNFQNLLICRDAYWKIAGEQMGLDKPWDLTYGCGEWGYWFGYSINENKIYLQDSRILVNHTLVFPTEEMRNVFYENFKELIEQCKELL